MTDQMTPEDAIRIIALQIEMAHQIDEFIPEEKTLMALEVLKKTNVLVHPIFILRADDPDAITALYTLGSLKDKPGPDRDAVLDAALAFSQYRDREVQS